MSLKHRHLHVRTVSITLSHCGALGDSFRQIKRAVRLTLKQGYMLVG